MDTTMKPLDDEIHNRFSEEVSSVKSQVKDELRTKLPEETLSVEQKSNLDYLKTALKELRK